MAWEIYFVRADERAHGQFFVTLRGKDGTREETYTDTVGSLNDATVKAMARQAIKELEDAVTGKSQLTIQPGDLIDLTPPGPPVDPDPEKTQFLKDYHKLQVLAKASEVGALPAANALLAQTKNAVNQQWRDEYADLI